MDRPKYRYRLAFERTKQNGYFDRKRTMYVAASSEAEAKRLVKETYPDAKALRIIASVRVSTAEVESSRMRIFGFFSKALAMHRRCF